MNGLPVSGPDAIRDSNDILPHFERFGKIGDIFLPIDRNSQRLRGFGFVRFHEKSDRDDCLDYYESHECEIRRASVG